MHKLTQKLSSFSPVLGIVICLAVVWTQNQVPEHHLPGFNSYCKTCHLCETPTKEDPCLLACPRHGGKFLGQHMLDEGPDIVIMDQLSELYGAVTFTHKIHASMSNMNGGCVKCHHYSEPDQPVPPCRECHDPTGKTISIQKPSLKAAYHRQCLNCHREWSHESSCSICHLEKESAADQQIVDKTDIIGVDHPHIAAEVKYVYHTGFKDGDFVTFHHTDHVDVFGLKCADCHEGDACARCHSEHENPVVKYAKEDQKEIRSNNCCKCHVESCQNPEHCVFCHDGKEKPAFNHALSTGWDLGNRHSQVTCDACHGPVKEFSVPSTTCTDCHIHWTAGSFNHSVTGLILNEEHEEFDCTDCHEDEEFDQVPTCSSCHDEDEIYYPDFLPGEKK